MPNFFSQAKPAPQKATPLDVDAAQLKADIDAASDAAIAEMDAENQKNSEVEHRLKKANAYLKVINEPYFGDNPTDAEVEVEDEIAAFAQTRLQKFLGMTAPDVRRDEPVAAEFPFDEQQTQALGMWANKLLKREATEAPAAPRPAPAVALQPATSPAPAPSSLAKASESTFAAARRRPGRPPGTGKNQRAAALPTIQKSEALTETALADGATPELPAGVTREPDGKLYQTVELTMNGEIVQKKILYQAPVKSLVTQGAPLPTQAQLENVAPVTQMRMSGGMGNHVSPNSMPSQVMDNLKNIYLR